MVFDKLAENVDFVSEMQYFYCIIEISAKLNYLTFREQFFDQACVNINQIYAFDPGFDRNNLSRWVKKGLLIRLRQGYYTFSEYMGSSDHAYYFANRIYKPSYISLYSALSFYGIIPEAVAQITSVTGLKTARFSNAFGEYTYRSVKEGVFFGYDHKEFGNAGTVLFAFAEKAIVDLLYLYPFYDTEDEMKYLRFDRDVLDDVLDMERLMIFTGICGEKALEKRIRLFVKVYGL